MCGICGKITFNSPPPQRDAIEKMRDTLAHRGPDDAGIYMKDNVALAHRRLSIIDLAGSAQPLCNEDSTVWIVFNGEVYNFESLRNELIELGHRFKTFGDTEVIVHLYEEYGQDCVTKLRGMFAFAIWDENKKVLFLARDRVGIKPLYYFSDHNAAIFASEIKAILADNYYQKQKEMDIEALHAYFSFLYVPAPLTIYKGIKKLLPGHTMTISADNEIKTKKYWDISFNSKTLMLDEHEICEKLFALIKESVKMRMISDVPLGAFLSGGMDSSTVVAMMASLGSQPIKTFAIGFSEKKYNEANDAREVANHFSTDHTEVILEPEKIMDDMLSLIVHFDEPFADSSLLPTYLVSKITREKVTVALSGDGGDELFGGYPWWQKRPSYQLKLLALPGPAKSMLQKCSFFIPNGIPGKHFLSKLNLSYPRYLLEAKAVFDLKGREFIYSEQTKELLKSSDPYSFNIQYLKNTNDQDWSDRIMEYDLKTYIPNDILQKVDMMSMYCSLEARVPLLDHKLIEFAAQIPADMKFKNGVSKYILKKTMESLLPKNIIYKKKQGFSIPLEHWLRTKMKDHLQETLFQTNRHGLFNTTNVKKMVEDFLAGNDAHKHRLWELYTFELWYQKHLQ